jgi:hypothetical protein
MSQALITELGSPATQDPSSVTTKPAQRQDDTRSQKTPPGPKEGQGESQPPAEDEELSLPQLRDPLSVAIDSPFRLVMPTFGSSWQSGGRSVPNQVVLNLWGDPWPMTSKIPADSDQDPQLLDSQPRLQTGPGASALSLGVLLQDEEGPGVGSGHHRS